MSIVTISKSNFVDSVVGRIIWNVVTVLIEVGVFS